MTLQEQKLEDTPNVTLIETPLGATVVNLKEENNVNKSPTKNKKERKQSKPKSPKPMNDDEIDYESEDFTSTYDVLLEGSDASDLVQLYSSQFEDEKKKKEDQMRNEINQIRSFYYKYDNLWAISLKNKDFFKRFRADRDFIGTRYEDFIKVNENSELYLVTMVVNERQELKNIGKYLFFREVYLCHRKSKSVLKLFNQLIGGSEQSFFVSEKDNIGFYRWKFIVHKNRLVYVKNKLVSKFNYNPESIKKIKSYEDVLKWVMGDYYYFNSKE